MSQLKVLIKRVDPSVPLPHYAKGGDAGADLVTTKDFTLAPGGARAHSNWHINRTS